MEKIKLSRPIEWNGTKIGALTMRRPKVRDMIAADRIKGNDGEKEANIFANLCEVELDMILELDLADYQQLQQTYTGFLSLPQGTQGAPASALQK
ncbi:MAG: phage tail assembly protein [Alphaproteobacteria bacterium]